MWNEKPKIVINHRIELFTWILFGIFVFLFFNLWYLSVLQSGLYQEKSERNRIRMIPLQAPRGIITDRYGQILAQDVPRFAAVLLPGSADPEKSRQILEKTIKRKIEEPLRDRYSGEIILASQMSIEEVAMVEETRKELPGVMIEAYPKRIYPPGEDIAHIVGYVGKINSEELKRFGQTNYNNEDVVGKSGIELNYEEFLRGQKGYRKIEVDALGRIVRILDTSFPRFRHTLTLT
jgi:penicillin-binding protein 2